ncbi:MAG TPA: aldose 1-epimerase [Actinospica sp.]|jgi:aldose 1-epimerase|nr:aldose 1-epimerase [Actinospica sp.]
MGNWTIEHTDRLGEAALSITGPGTSAAVSLRGATLLNWQVARDGDLLDLTDGYRDAAEFREQSGVRNGILAPFPNRVADSRYTFRGEAHDLLPGVEGDRTTYHGFARELPFEPHDTITSPDSARVVLRSQEIRPTRFAGYPFALDLTVAYTFEPDQLTLEIEAVNVGPTPAPYAAGWHPYFQLGNGTETIDDLELHIPADTLIRTDEALIPLPGPAGYADLATVPDMDFRHPRPVADRIIDACYVPAPGAATTLRDPQTGRRLRIWQDTGYMHVFTGDTLPRDRRGSIALEPVEALTNAYNRDEFATGISLAPAERRVFRCGVALR